MRKRVRKTEEETPRKRTRKTEKKEETKSVKKRIKIRAEKEVVIPKKDLIALKCGQCVCFDWESAIKCPDRMCALHSIRPKKRKDILKATFWDDENGAMIAIPMAKKSTRKLTDEQKKAASERFKKLHAQGKVGKRSKLDK